MRSLVIGLLLGLGIAIVAQQTSTSSTVRGGGSASGSATASGSAFGQGGGSGSGSGSGGTRSIPMPTHAIIWEPGPSWIEGRPVTEQPGFQAHIRYLLQFVKTGQNLLSGPWRDEPGGLTILSVRTDEQAQRIAYEDPAVKSGLFVPQVKAWKVVMGSIAPATEVRVGSGSE